MNITVGLIKLFQAIILLSCHPLHPIVHKLPKGYFSILLASIHSLHKSGSTSLVSIVICLATIVYIHHISTEDPDKSRLNNNLHYHDPAVKYVHLPQH
jgi:hypothetical protein